MKLDILWLDLIKGILAGVDSKKFQHPPVFELSGQSQLTRISEIYSKYDAPTVQYDSLVFQYRMFIFETYWFERYKWTKAVILMTPVIVLGRLGCQ